MKLKITFKKGLIIYAAIALVLLMIGLYIFWGFIDDYEESMPIYGMDKVVEDFKNNNLDEYLSSVVNGVYNEFETDNEAVRNEIISAYKKFVEGKEVSFIKAKEYTDKSPQYIIMAGDAKVAKVTLSAKTKNDSDFDVWSYDSIEVSEYLVNILKTKDYTVTVPEGTEITVNGKKLSDSYIKESKEIKELAEVGKYVAVPKMNTYEIKGFYSEPEIKGVCGGKELALKHRENMLIM